MRQKHAFAQAKADFDAALKLDPGKRGAAGGRPSALAGLNRIDDASVDANAAIKLMRILPRER